MNHKVYGTLFLAGSMVATECLGFDGKAHIEPLQYEEAPTLTYFVNSTATVSTYRSLFFFDDGFDPYK